MLLAPFALLTAACGGGTSVGLGVLTEAPIASAPVAVVTAAAALPAPSPPAAPPLPAATATATAQTSPAPAVDGELDCLTELEFTVFSEFDDPVGNADAATAVTETLAFYRESVGGEIVLRGEDAGSVVTDGREVAVTTASPTQGGGWRASTVDGCDEPGMPSMRGA